MFLTKANDSQKLQISNISGAIAAAQAWTATIGVRRVIFTVREPFHRRRAKEKSVLDTARRFTSYLERKSLPCTAVEARQFDNGSVAIALIDHAPSPGNQYPPVDDLIVSIVVRSNYGIVERDVGAGQQIFREGPDCILVTPPRTASYWSFTGSPQVIHIAISATCVDEFIDQYSGERLPTLASLAERPIADPLIALLGSRMWLSSLDGSHLGHELGERATQLLLPALFKRQSAATGPCSSTRLPQWRCRRAQDLMLERLDGKLSIEELAANIGLSASHFVRAFKATTGQSPHQWMAEKRIERAKQLLRESERPLTEIAVSLGYASASHFSSAFRAATGSTPRVWRAAFRLGDVDA